LDGDLFFQARGLSGRNGSGIRPAINGQVRPGGVRGNGQLSCPLPIAHPPLPLEISTEKFQNRGMFLETQKVAFN
jgi:hypothetical protein